MRTYLEGVARLRAFLADCGLPLDLESIRRAHIEEWVAAMLRDGKPSSAANRFRSAQQFFRWAVNEGELTVSPMAGMRPPRIPESPPPILRADDIRRLLKACTGPSIEAPQDEALIRVFIGHRCAAGRGRLPALGSEQRRTTNLPT